MADEKVDLSKFAMNSKIDPTEYDLTISALLIGLGAEKYSDIFRKRNIGQCTLMELTDEDLKKMGVDDPEIRNKLINEVKNLPIYDETDIIDNTSNIANLGPMEIFDVLEESSQHLYRIYLSMLANSLALKKTKDISDCLLYRDKYASDIALSTLSEINSILNSMDSALQIHLKVHTQKTKTAKYKKILVGSVGSAAIAVLAMYFIRSVRQLQA